jgi:hypothetical protein
MATMNDVPTGRAGRVEVRSAIEIGAGVASLLAVRVAAMHAPGQLLVEESLAIGDAPLLSEGSSNRLARAVTDGCPTRLEYRAAIDLVPTPTVDDLDFTDYVAWVSPSRYCPSDQMLGFARAQFGELGPTTIDDVAAFVNARTQYSSELSDGNTTALDTLATASGVCRDFSQLTITLLRAMGVPARYVAVYAPWLDPPDFHAIVEAHDGERWRLLDSTGLSDPTYAVRIGVGRDSADVPFLTVLTGSAPIVQLEVSAVVRA